MLNLSVTFEVVNSNVATGKQVNVSDLDFLKIFDRIAVSDWLERENTLCDDGGQLLRQEEENNSNKGIFFFLDRIVNSAIFSFDT